MTNSLLISRYSHTKRLVRISLYPSKIDLVIFPWFSHDVPIVFPMCSHHVPVFSHMFPAFCHDIMALTNTKHNGHNSHNGHNDPHPYGIDKTPQTHCQQQHHCSDPPKNWLIIGSSSRLNIPAVVEKGDVGRRRLIMTLCKYIIIYIIYIYIYKMYNIYIYLYIYLYI